MSSLSKIDTRNISSTISSMLETTNFLCWAIRIIFSTSFLKKLFSEWSLIKVTEGSGETVELNFRKWNKIWKKWMASGGHLRSDKSHYSGGPLFCNFRNGKSYKVRGSPYKIIVHKIRRSTVNYTIFNWFKNVRIRWLFLKPWISCTSKKVIFSKISKFLDF